MCAIMGFTSPTLKEETMRPFFDRTLSRGPDQTRVEPAGKGWLCFHRLAIMGLSEEGMQPFHLGGDMVVCNGEIYGFRKLRAQLAAKYTFRSESDCEIPLPLYREYVLEMFKMLDAEFAMILYDAQKDSLIAARDPIGIRPLFYGYSESGRVGFLLSGGLDSSLVCAIAAKKLGKPIRTFAIGMSEDAIDLKYAKQVADYLHADHTEVIINRDIVVDALNAETKE